MSILNDIGVAFRNSISTKVIIEGANCQQAHDAMHKLNIGHHAPNNFNGNRFARYGDELITLDPDNKVEICLISKDPNSDVEKLRNYNPSWKVYLKQ